jgi:hypothetical protein
MVKRYEMLWPDNPFTFLLPYQEILPPHHDKIIGVNTPASIKATVLTLLKDIPDDEWIYWCIDDKYPEQLNTGMLNHIYKEIILPDNSQFDGVLFWSRKSVGASIPNKNHVLTDAKDNKYFQRKGYSQIWLHQFVRAKIIKDVFTQFPDVISKAKEMDALVKKISTNPKFRLYITEASHGFFGESISGGRLTRNCFDSMGVLQIDKNTLSVNHKQYYYIGYPIKFPWKTSYIKFFMRKFYWQLRKKLK